MAYKSTCPSLAAGGKLVKRGAAKPKATAEKRQHPNTVPEPKEWKLTTEYMAESISSGWDEGGWHGGGMMPVRKTQKTRPSKGNTTAGRFAHPSIIRP